MNESLRAAAAHFDDFFSVKYHKILHLAIFFWGGDEFV